jgi:hypothetical protein
MRESDIWQLAVAAAADIPRQHIRKGTLSESEGLKFHDALSELSGRPLYVVDRSRFPVDEQNPEAPTMQAIAQVLREGERFCRWRLVFIDYLMKVGPFEGDDLTRLPRLTSWVFDLAQRLDVHIVALAQSAKSSWGRTDGSGARTVALQDSKGGIENVADFDAAIGLVRDDWNTERQEDSPTMRAVVLKARHAPGGVCRLTFHRRTGRIEEAPPEKVSFAEMASFGRRKSEPSGTEEQLLACFPAEPAPKAVIVLRAEEAGIPKARAGDLLAGAVHSGKAFRARIGGQQLYARTKESLEALVKPPASASDDNQPSQGSPGPVATEPTEVGNEA